jgi:hypothetical protein
MTEFSLGPPPSPKLPSFSIIPAELPGGQQLLVISGIAEPDWYINDDDNLYVAGVGVHLGVWVAEVKQSTVTGGLCSVANGNSKFTFALDRAGLLPLEDTGGELVLGVTMSAQGAETALSRFGFQVVAVVTQTTTKITGVITWNNEMWQPVAGSSLISEVTANVRIVVSELVEPTTPGTFASWQPIAQGRIVAVEDIIEGLPVIVAASYEIDGLPLTRNLSLSVIPSPAFRAPAGSAVVVLQTTGQPSFVLTAAAPDYSANFRIATAPLGGPK